MRKFMFVATILLLVAPMAFAASPQTANGTIQASISANCTIAWSAAVDFGAYDPIVTNLATDLTDGTQSITVKCTKKAPVNVELGNGSNFSGGRRMKTTIAGTDYFLNYNLYLDAAFATQWTTGATNRWNIASAAGTAGDTHLVYGKVPGAQDAAVGSYTDTVQASVNF